MAFQPVDNIVHSSGCGAAFIGVHAATEFSALRKIKNIRFNTNIYLAYLSKGTN